MVPTKTGRSEPLLKGEITMKRLSVTKSKELQDPSKLPHRNGFEAAIKFGTDLWLGLNGLPLMCGTPRVLLKEPLEWFSHNHRIALSYSIIRSTTKGNWVSVEVNGFLTNKSSSPSSSYSALFHLESGEPHKG